MVRGLKTPMALLYFAVGSLFIWATRGGADLADLGSCLFGLVCWYRGCGEAYKDDARWKAYWTRRATLARRQAQRPAPGPVPPAPPLPLWYDPHPKQTVVIPYQFEKKSIP